MKLYKHFKGRSYKVHDIVKHSETLDDLILYETLYDNPLGKFWVRPKKMFFGKVRHKGRPVRRFQRVAFKFKSLSKIRSPETRQIESILLRVFKPFNKLNFRNKLKDIKRVYLVVAYINDKPVGFKLGYQHDVETFYSWLGAVLPEYQSLGIGSELMRRQHKWCVQRDYKKIQTQTKNKWKDMIILNLRSGFDITGTYTDEKGEPKLILEKSL